MPNLINHQPDIDKTYLYTKDWYKAKYQFWINKRENVGLKNYNDLKGFNEYSNNTQDVYKNIEEYNPWRKRQVLLVFDDMIVDMISNKTMNSIVTELGKKWNISVFIAQPYFKVPKDVTLSLRSTLW